MAETKPPKVFISYAWEDDLKTWVLDFATRLRSDGINAILDQWETVPGDQLTQFMEKSVRESDYVVFVCTPTYKRKSDRRRGGVGYEGSIITGEVFQKNNHRKFIPVLRKGKWVSAAPSWATSKLFIDFRGEPYSEASYQHLLDTLVGKSPTAPPLRDDTLREKIESETAEKAERVKVENEKVEREAAKRLAHEEAARDKAEKDTIEKARLEAEELARQKAEKEKAERDAAEKVVRKKQAREANEGAKQESETLEKVTPKKAMNKPVASKSMANSQIVYWLGGFVVLVVGIFFLYSLNNPPVFPESTPTNTRLVNISTPMTSITPESSTTTMTASQPLAQVVSSYINFYFEEIEILGNIGDNTGPGEFRLIVLAADTTGKSSDMYCPGDEPLNARKGDIVEFPCLLSVSFDEAKVSDGVYIVVMAINETKSPLPADITYETISDNLGSAFGNAVSNEVVKVEAIDESGPYNFSVDVLMNLVVGQVRTWLEKAEFVGIQGIYLSRQDYWSVNKSNTVTSSDGGIQITYTIIRTSSEPPPTRTP